MPQGSVEDIAGVAPVEGGLFLPPSTKEHDSELPSPRHESHASAITATSDYLAVAGGGEQVLYVESNANAEGIWASEEKRRDLEGEGKGEGNCDGEAGDAKQSLPSSELYLADSGTSWMSSSKLR